MSATLVLLIACTAATALHYSRLGKKTLTISTDPTPSLGHIFEVGRCRNLTGIEKNLFVHEIGVDEIKKMWDTKFGKEVYDVFSAFVDIEYNDFVDFMTSILPGMRDEFTVDYINTLHLSGDYDIIIWDTAPMGQTLGLLGMPAMLLKHLRGAPKIYSKLKFGNSSKKPVLDIIKGWEDISNRDLKFLIDEVSLNIVTIPEALAVEQLDEVFNEMGKYDLNVTRLIINNVITDSSSTFLKARQKMQRRYIELLTNKYNKLQIIEIPMFSEQVTGLNSINSFQQALYDRTSEQL